MIPSLNKSAKNFDSAPSLNQKKLSIYDYLDKHSNEVSIILVITDENLHIDDLISNKRKKSRHTSNSSANTETSEYRDRLNYFNLICSHSEFQNIDDHEKLKKFLFKNLQKCKLKKFKKDELEKDNEIRQAKSKKSSKEHNIYGPVTYIPTKYSRPPLPPFFKDKWAHTVKELKEKKANTNVLNKFLYSKYEFEHLTPSCSSESEKSSDCEALVRDDSFELRPSDFSIKPFALDEKIQIGDRPDKNLEIKNQYFRIQGNDVSLSSQSSSSCSEFNEEIIETDNFSFPISRQNRVIFYESNKKNNEHVKYEANLPKLPDQSAMLSIPKRFEFNNCPNNLDLKNVRKKDIGHGLKNFNQSERKNLSVISEEENLSHQEDEIMEKEQLSDLNGNLDENSIQQDIDLASESLSSTVSSIQCSDDQDLNDYYHQSEHLNIKNEDFYKLIKHKQKNSFKSLYNNYLSLIDKKFTMSIPRHKIDNKDNLVYI